MNLMQNIKAAYGEDAFDADRGDLVQTIIITALFAIATITVGGWLITSMMNKGADTANCIEGSTSYAQQANGGKDDSCAKNHASEESNSYNKSDSYGKRYN